MQKIIFNWIFTLKALAIILITNSHFKPIYSESFSQLAFGGAMGCSLFFFCSGYTMANIETDSFWKFIKKRVIKIFPPVWIFLIAISHSTCIKDYFLLNSYWFLQAIFIFYILFYFIMKYIKRYLLYIPFVMFILMLICYFIGPHDTWSIDYPRHPLRITWFYYFAIMIIGTYLRLNESNKTDKKYIYLSIISFLALYGIKFIGRKFGTIIDIQLLFPVLLVITTLFMYKASQYIKIDKFKYINNIILFLQKYTLEIYITQFVCINTCARIDTPFVRILLIVPFIITSAFILNKFSTFIINKLRFI